MDVLARMEELLKMRKWKLNQLARRSGVPQSTLSGLYARNNIPTIPTLEKICEALGITLSEFFAPEGRLIALTDEQYELLQKWQSLSPNIKEAIWAMLEML